MWKVSAANGRCGRGLLCLLIAVVVLVGCGIGGSTTQPVAVGLVTATATRPPATNPPTPSATATTPATPTTAPTATHAQMSALPSHEPAASPTAAETPTAIATDPGVVEVRIIDFSFDPPVLEVPIGTTVVWRLVEGYHTVVSPDFRLNSPILENGGDTYSYTFTEEGIYDYICGIHPDMLGLVQVVP